ncbi:MAG: DmsE family decaheme c-type cytochrome [Candidatus Acidiferrales bacterium]
MNQKTTFARSLKALGLLIASGMLSAGAFAQTAAKPTTAAKAPAAAADKSAAIPADGAALEYVGAEVCKTCHEDLYNGWEKSPHWKTTLDSKDGPSHQGCEGCHGPGSAHVAGGGDKTKIFVFEDHSAKEVNERCLTCHAGGTQHMNAINSVHAKNDVSCIACHSPHHGNDANFLLVKSQPELCYTCHLQQKAQFEMPFHHRVNEGLVQCSDCHNVHGTVRPKQVRTSATQDEVCFKCHTDKQGPFVYEHTVVKVDGCEACHLTHGGPNPHMLKLSNVNLLCLQCHTTSFSSAPGAPSFHNQSTFFQACTLCHVEIHGSNFDATFFK